MRPERQFIADHTVARHCPDLLCEAPQPDDLLPRLAALGEHFSARFARALPSLVGGDKPAVQCSAPRVCTFGQFGEEIGPLAANSLLSLAMPGVALLLSVEARAVLRLIDRAFGGRGDVPAQLPAQFPVSGDLLIAKLERLATDALCGALGPGSAVAHCRRDSNVARLAAFADTAQVAVLDIAVEEQAASWQASLAVPLSALPALFGAKGAARPVAKANQDRAMSLAAPFDELPLQLRAILVDMSMPVSKLSALAPGQVIPVPVARNIPLVSGTHTLAHGAIGTMEDRVAVRLTQSFQQQEPAQ